MLEAAGRCPPEDVGGAHGYAEYLDAISDPTHPEHENMRLWGPERFDPNVVDRKTLEAAVNALSGIWKPRVAPHRSNRRQASIKRAAELRLRSAGWKRGSTRVGGYSSQPRSPLAVARSVARCAIYRLTAQVTHSLGFPDRFILHFEHSARRSSVIWRKEKQVGMRFES
ncbi:IS1096 element passenger TnpR family protein [Bradyrhizobium sp.]|uniref:IS1096 element passenger TnpR family protein n=1 Tax=Bradyrhizobium sp. TaxID=376 RepID=UPI00391B81E7